MAYRFPSKDEIEWAVRRIHPNWAKGPSRMWVYYLNIWLAVAQAEEKPDPYRWWISVEIIQLAFDIGELALDCAWNTVILLPKGGGEYQVIGFVEALCKVISIIIDWSLAESI